MLKQTEEEIEAAAKLIGTALDGIHQVTFTMDVSISRTWQGKKSTYIIVTLWFGHEFSKLVTGGDDIESLAESCRKVAMQRLSKIQEIAKASSSEGTG